jgi:hypothetical protein
MQLTKSRLFTKMEMFLFPFVAYKYLKCIRANVSGIAVSTGSSR